MATIVDLTRELQERRRAREQAERDYRATVERTTDGRAVSGAKSRLMNAAKNVRSAERALDAALVRAARVNGSTRPERPYSPADESANFFKDVAAAATGNSAAIERLERNERIRWGGERRIVGYQSGWSAPEWIASAFATAPRSASVVRSACTRIELPPTGRIGQIPRVEVGVTVSGAQANPGDDVTGGDSSFASETADSELATFAVTADISRPLFERCLPSAALGFAKDMSEALDASVDAELIDGPAATANRLIGLLNVPGAGSASYTDASPTPAAMVQAIGQAAASYFRARQAPAEYLLLHPDIAYFLGYGTASTIPVFEMGGLASGATDAAWSAGSFAGLRLLISSQMPTNIGGSQSAAVLFRGSDAMVAWSEARYVFGAARSDMNIVRVQAVQYAQFWAHRQPASVLVLGGSGFVPVTGWHA